jgi:tetratricopeptide (TPR) repeat protein
LLLLPAFAGCTSAPPDEQLRAQANELHRRKDYAAAMQSYDRALQANPHNGHAWNDRGVLRRITGDLAGAMADFEQGIRVEPRYGTLYYQRGYTRVNGIDVGSPPGQFSDADLRAALVDYERAIELNPADRDARLGRFVVFIVQRNAPAAEAEVARWLKQDLPAGAEADVWRGILLVLRRQDAEAQKIFERYYRRHPATREATERDLTAIRAALK